LSFGGGGGEEGGGEILLCCPRLNKKNPQRPGMAWEVL
jgi:hypothetical protein